MLASYLLDEVTLNKECGMYLATVAYAQQCMLCIQLLVHYEPTK